MKRWITGGLAAVMLFSSLLTVPLEAYAEPIAGNEVSYSTERDAQSEDASGKIAESEDTNDIEVEEENLQQKDTSLSLSEEPTNSPSPTPTASIQPSPTPEKEENNLPTPSPVKDKQSLPTPSPMKAFANEGSGGFAHAFAGCRKYFYSEPEP